MRQPFSPLPSLNDGGSSEWFASISNTFTGQTETFNSYGIIPKPQQIHSLNGTFALLPSINVNYWPNDSKLKSYAENIHQLLKPYSSATVQLNEVMENGISLCIDEELSLPLEGYSLVISTSHIELKAKSNVGIFYAIQTFIQLIHKHVISSSSSNSLLWLPCLKIEDWPQWQWRGLHVDSARHFQSLSTIKSVLDIMALYKFNKFHWHLTDDQGWRIESFVFPQLHQIGGTRPSFFDRNVNETQYYTQTEIKEIIAYAKERGINVIPEIDFPAHASAFLAAFPHLACMPSYERNVKVKWGIFSDVLCPYKKETFLVVRSIIDEVIELFSDGMGEGEGKRMIHLGGDEAIIYEWEFDEECKKWMFEESLTPQSVQTYFTTYFRKILREQNAVMIAWNEVMNHVDVDIQGPNDDLIIHAWQKESFVKAIEQGFKTIISDIRYFYFDFDLSDTPLQKTFAFNPFEYFSNDRVDMVKENVLGIEGCLWSEYIPEDLLFAKMMPRLLALSSVAWTNPLSATHPSWSEFHSDLESHQFMIQTLFKHTMNDGKTPLAPLIIPPFNLVTNMKIWKEQLPQYAFDGKQGTFFEAVSVKSGQEFVINVPPALIPFKPRSISVQSGKWEYGKLADALGVGSQILCFVTNEAFWVELGQIEPDNDDGKITLALNNDKKEISYSAFKIVVNGNQENLIIREIIIE